MNRCDQENRLTPYLLGDLSERDEAEYSRHLAGCTACQACAQELAPLLQTLADGLAKDGDKQPRFDLHHQLKLLSVPAENPHRVIEWMARSRPWLVAAACALVVTGLTYTVLFASMRSRYYTLGTAAAGAAQTQRPPGWFERLAAPARPAAPVTVVSHEVALLEEPADPSDLSSADGGRIAFGARSATLALESSNDEAAPGKDGTKDLPKTKTLFYNCYAGGGGKKREAAQAVVDAECPEKDDHNGLPASELSKVEEPPIDTGLAVARELGKDYRKLPEKPIVAGGRVAAMKGLYASRTEDGRKKALEKYNGEPSSGGISKTELAGSSANEHGAALRPSGSSGQPVDKPSDLRVAAERTREIARALDDVSGRSPDMKPYLDRMEFTVATVGGKYDYAGQQAQQALGPVGVGNGTAVRMDATSGRNPKRGEVDGKEILRRSGYAKPAELEKKSGEYYADYTAGVDPKAPDSDGDGSSKGWSVEAFVETKPGDAPAKAAPPPPQPRRLAGAIGRAAGVAREPLRDAAWAEAARMTSGTITGSMATTTNAMRVSASTPPPPPTEPAAPKPPRAKATAFNPFIATTDEHFSTFAIDVSTASYNLMRQAIHAGALPDPDVVRTEAILNAFDYGDTAPDRATFRVYVEGAPSAFGLPGTTLLRIGVKGKRLGREEQRPAMLTFLIDTSGSMAQPDRIGRARTALRLLLDQLSPRDKIQLISFDDKARLVLAPTPATEKAAILQAFDRLQCNGSTNLEDGMHRAYQQAARAFVAGGENRVILISDGVANLGADNAQDILRQVEAFRKQGVTCSVFGVGEGTYNDAMLEDLANKGQGVYRFLDSEDEVRRVFVDDLAATLNNIATDVKIQVEWSTDTVRRFRQLGYERRKLKAEQFRDDTVEAGEVGSGQSVTALYELDLAASAKHASLGTVRVRYRRADTGSIEEIEQAITPEMIAPSLKATRPQFRLAAGAAAFAELLRGSPHVTCEYADVVRVLRPVAQELSLDPRVKELVALAEAAEGLSK